MSRSSQAEAYDRAKIRLEIVYLEIPRIERNLNHYARRVQEDRRQGLRSSVHEKYLTVYQMKLDKAEERKRKGRDRIRDADRALGERMRMEYEQLRKRGMPRETADQIARTNNYKYEDSYYRAQARRQFERDQDDDA